MARPLRHAKSRAVKPFISTLDRVIKWEYIREKKSSALPCISFSRVGRWRTLVNFKNISPPKKEVFHISHRVFPIKKYKVANYIYLTK